MRFRKTIATSTLAALTGAFGTLGMSPDAFAAGAKGETEEAKDGKSDDKAEGKRDGKRGVKEAGKDAAKDGPRSESKARANAEDGDPEAEEAGEDEPRKFNDVLMDLLNEFAYDMKMGLLKGVPNTALRRVALSEGVPKSYETYIESLASERLHKYGGIKVIQCAQCKVKRSYVERGRVVISTPINNPAELDKISDVLKIETWTDVALLYQESGMLLAFNVFDAKTKELVWTKIYNSETLYRKVVKPRDMAAGPEAEEKKEEEPKSRYVFSLGVGWVMVPNVKKVSNMVGASIRLAEVFNQDRSEIGGKVMPVADPGIFVKNYDGVEGDPAATAEVTKKDGTKASIKPFSFGLGLFATYNHNFIKAPENFDEFRYGAHVSLGGLFAKGYITFTGRVGPSLKLGRHFFAEAGAMYSAPTTLTIQDIYQYKTKGGIGADVTFGLLF